MRTISTDSMVGKLMKYIIKLAGIVTIGLSVSACAPPATVDFNGHSVKIRTSSNLASDKQAALVQAQSICGKVGKRAEYASTTYVHDLNIQHLFLCI